jgi:hypothetical protein
MELENPREVEAYFLGKRDGVRAYAWWKDGIQYVGTTGRTLDTAKQEILQEKAKALVDLSKRKGGNP